MPPASRAHCLSFSGASWITDAAAAASAAPSFAGAFPER
jgi:hypothetical protein